MSSLIDVDKIKLDYSGLAYISPNDFIGIAKYFADQIKSAPAVDAVEVVRCKDCKNFSGVDDDDETVTAIGFCRHPRHVFYPCRFDFFCADGERSEER